MRILLLVTGLGVLVVGGCTSTAQHLAWGKPGVTRAEFGTEVGMCAGDAVLQDSGDNGANKAGGINGSNNVANRGSEGSSGASMAASAGSAVANGQPGPVAPSLPAGGTYSGMTSTDFAQRAATQQRSQEMAAQRARSEALRGCLTRRGYQEFELTAAQRAHLTTLKKGGDEYHEYLYQLGSSAEIVGKQSRAAAR